MPADRRVSLCASATADWSSANKPSHVKKARDIRYAFDRVFDGDATQQEVRAAANRACVSLHCDCFLLGLPGI